MLHQRSYYLSVSGAKRLPYLAVCGGRGEFMEDVLCCIIISGLVSCPADKVVSQSSVISPEPQSYHLGGPNGSKDLVCMKDFDICNPHLKIMVWYMLYESI